MGINHLDSGMVHGLTIWNFCILTRKICYRYGIVSSRCDDARYLLLDPIDAKSASKDIGKRVSNATAIVS